MNTKYFIISLRLKFLLKKIIMHTNSYHLCVLWIEGQIDIKLEKNHS
jgi:hypothetical protein